MRRHDDRLLRLSRIDGFANDQRGYAVTGTVEIDEDLTIVDPLWCFGTLKPLDGVTVSINGPFVAGSSQCFDLSAGGTIAGKPEIEAVNPVWWGADPDHTRNSSPAINAALAFCNGSFKPAVQFIAGHYLCRDQILKPHSFYCPTIRGVGGGNTTDPGGTVLDFQQSRLGEDDACIVIKGGSGKLVTGGLDRITIAAASGQTGLCIADQGGVLVSNVIVHGGKDSVRVFNEVGFSEWNKFVNCTFNGAERSNIRFEVSEGTDSFHGCDVLDCWFQMSHSQPSAIHAGARSFWYNGTLRARVFFDGNPDGYQDVLSVDYSARDPQLEGYIKTESGAGRGRLGSGRNVDWCGPVLACTGITWGSFRPLHYSMWMGPEGGPSNGSVIKFGAEASYGPRPITVDANGEWYTGMYLTGDFDCEILLRAEDYEYHISGVARPHHMGGEGIFQVNQIWPLTNRAGYGPPSLSVKADGGLYLQNANYAAVPGQVYFYIWHRQRSMSLSIGHNFSTMTA